MSYLRYLCLHAYSGVQHILCCVVHRMLYPLLPVSLDCQFSIAPLVFPNVYLKTFDLIVKEVVTSKLLRSPP